MCSRINSPLDFSHPMAAATRPSLYFSERAAGAAFIIRQLELRNCRRSWPRRRAARFEQHGAGLSARVNVFFLVGCSRARDVCVYKCVCGGAKSS